MNPLLHDLLGHQFWADTTLWDAIAAHDQASRDAAIHARLHHIHQVQRAFFWLASGDARPPFSMSKPDDFATLDALRSYARDTHSYIRATLAGLSEDRLSASVSPPWFKDPPLTLTITEALTQCAMHSQHHRGQNATRLRELGGEPPPTDLIVWYWKGRPAAML